MNSKIMRNLIVIYCMFLILADFTENTIAQEEKSILSRIQKIEDPELGELISIALENFESPELEELKIYESANITNLEYAKLQNSVQTQKLQIVRKVTEAYSEIKLLDSQIEQIEKRLNSSDAQFQALANELLLAKTELETKLTIKLAELREIMNIIPIHPLGRRPLEQLNSWIKLDVIGEQVAVFKCSKPFSERSMKYNFIKVMSNKEALDYVTSNVNTLPVRIDILRYTRGIKLSEELNKQIIDSIKDKKLEMQAEVHLDDEIRTQLLSRRFIIQNGKIGTKISGSSNTSRKLSGLIDPNDVGRYFIRQVGVLPQEFLLQYDKESKDLALNFKEKINNIAQEKGMEKVISVKMSLYNLEDDQ